MALLKILSVAVFFCLVFGANIPPLSISPSCPRTHVGLGSQPQFECSSSIDWLGDGFNVEDCRAAIQRLYNVEVTKHGSTEFEFLLPGAIPYTSNPVMNTPRKYRVGKCTLAIIMLAFFPYGSLPGQDPFSHYDYTDTDVATFQDLWLAADFIETCCLQSEHIPGWSLVGYHGSMGVFVWTTNSAEDRMIPRGAPTLSLQSNITRLYDSVNESGAYTRLDE